MSKGRVLFFLILLCALGWVTYTYLLPAFDVDVGILPISRGPEQGITLFRSGDYTGAARILKREVSQGRDTPEILLYLGKSLKELGENRDAEKHLDSLLKKYPSSREFSEALYILGDLAGNPAQKSIRWQKLLEKSYDSSWAALAAAPLGDMLASSGKLFEARFAYSKALMGNLSGEEEQRIKKALTDINKTLVFSPVPTPDSTVYVIKAGDGLDKIARKHNTTAGFLRIINGLEGSMIFPEQELKIINAPVSVLVERDRFRLTLFLGKHWFKEYNVGIGAEQTTPIGSFKVTNKLINPDWFRLGKPTIRYGDQENILGTRWIGLSKKGYGIHGTTQPESVGKAVSKGCIRLMNSDVEELFEFVVTGTEIEIR